MPEPRAVEPGTAGKPPSAAVVLFDGSGVSQWTRRDGSPTGCRAQDGEMVCPAGAADAYSNAKLRSAQFHVEVLIPDMPGPKGRLKGTSGIYLQGITEIQVLDSWRNPTYAMGYLGAVYSQHPPRRHGSVSVLINGVVVQNGVRLEMRPAICEPGPLMLQDHSGFPGAPHTEMRFRNLWARSLA